MIIKENLNSHAINYKLPIETPSLFGDCMNLICYGVISHTFISLLSFLEDYT